MIKEEDTQILIRSRFLLWWQSWYRIILTLDWWSW